MRAQRIPGRTAGMLIGRSNGSVGGSKGIAHTPERRVVLGRVHDRPQSFEAIERADVGASCSSWRSE
jgi:hypothetical protein